MKFIINKDPSPLQFTLIYREDEFSFDVSSHDGVGYTDILINCLQLEIDYEGELRYVLGYCPLFRYEETDKTPTNFESKSIVVIVDKPLVPGVSIRLNQDDEWPTFINKKDGWVCLGDPEIEGKHLVEFAPNCVASLVGESLVAVWLHPKSLPMNI